MSIFLYWTSKLAYAGPIQHASIFKVIFHIRKMAKNKSDKIFISIVLNRLDENERKLTEVFLFK